MNLNEQYRAWLHMRRPEVAQYAGGEDVPMDADAARLRRDKASHRGIGKRTALRELAASSVNQNFLEELAQLTDLLSTAINAPRRQFEALHRVKPRLMCDWFRQSRPDSD